MNCNGPGPTLKLLAGWLLMLVPVASVFAASYSLPADIGRGAFSSCNASYSCSGDLRLSNNDTVALTADVTLTVARDFVTGNGVTISGGGHRLVVNVGRDVDIGNNNTLAVTINSGDDVSIGNGSTVMGDITAVDRLDIGNNSAVNGTCIPNHPKCSPPPQPATPIAHFGLDETTLNGTPGELVDSQGNFTAAFVLGTGAGVGSTAQAKICRALDVPANGSVGAQWGADTGVDVDDDIGSSGSITFWYRANADWNSGTQRMLLDASQTGGANSKFFHVSVTTDGRIRLYIEDSNDTDLMTDTPRQSVTAGTWKHIAVSWDLPNDTYRIYIDGALVATGTDNSNGTIGELQSLYLGDNRSDYHYGGSNDSANGIIDEVRVYDRAITAQNVLYDYNRSGSCPPVINNMPYAEFRLEAVAGAWNGTPGEVVDTQGASTAGRASGTGAGVDTTANGKICRGGVIPNNTSVAARYFIDSGVDLDGALGGSGSVTFWYRSNTPWVGGGDRMLLDASEDNRSNAKYFYLVLQNNGALFFRFEDSADADIGTTAPTQAVAANTWKHIGLTWDLPADTYRIYVDGTLVVTGTDNSNGVIGTLETLVFGDNRGDYHPGGSDSSANGTLDELRLYNRTLSPAEVQADFTNNRTCAPPPVADADAFNCVVSGSNALNGHLYLQLAGAPFSFDVVALQDSDNNGTVDALHNAFASDIDRTVTVELVDASGGGACAARPALAVSQLLTFVAADGGRKVALPMTVSSAHRALGCRVTDALASPPVVACSTDTFAVRPQSLSLAPPALNNAGSSGLPRAAAGSAFSLSVTGGAGYDGTPKVDNGLLEAHAGAVQVGTLSGGFGAADPLAGTASGTAFAYSEVGGFRFAAHGLYDDDFAALDASNGDCSMDFSNVRVGGRYGCLFGNAAATAWIGRFHPANLTVSKLADGSLRESCAIGGFSYQGQEVAQQSSIAFRVTALNSGGVVTQNYTGPYAKLTATDFVFDPVSADAAALGADGVTPVQASWSTAGSRSLVDNLDGTLDFSISGAGFTWGRGANDIVAPFTTGLDIGLPALSDSDGVTASGLPVTANPGGVEMRYGRVALGNAHGSELQHLAMPLRVEYFAGAGNGFVSNAADSCTSVTALALADLDGADALVPGETCVWDLDDDSGIGCTGSGPAGMEFESLATAGQYSLFLKAPGAGNVGVLGLSVNVPAHLRFDWLGGGDTNPGARATFGIFSRPSNIIYRRELR